MLRNNLTVNHIYCIKTVQLTTNKGIHSHTNINTVHLENKMVIRLRCLLAWQKNILHRKTGELYLPSKFPGSLSNVLLVYFCSSTFSPLHITPLMLHHSSMTSWKISVMSPVLQEKKKKISLKLYLCRSSVSLCFDCFWGKWKKKTHKQIFNPLWRYFAFKKPKHLKI